MVKNLPAMQEAWVQSLGWEDPLEEGMATHFSILAWRIPWTEELAWLQPMGCKESDMTKHISEIQASTERKTASNQRKLKSKSKAKVKS